MATAADYVIVGSGINGLTCAALLGKSGQRVLRAGARGGGRRLHADGGDHRARLPARRDGGDLRAVHHLAGLRQARRRPGAPRPRLRAHADARPACCCRTGRASSFRPIAQPTWRASTQVMAGEGDRFAADVDTVAREAPLLFGLLGGALWTWSTAKLLFGEGRRRGPRGLAARLGEALISGRGWLETRYRSELDAGALRPMGAACRARAGKRLRRRDRPRHRLRDGGGRRAGGERRRRQGGRKRSSGLIEEQGGEVRTGADVAEILVSDGQATGVRLAERRDRSRRRAASSAP